MEGAPRSHGSSAWTTFLSLLPVVAAFDQQFPLLFLATRGAPYTSQTLQALRYFTASLAPPSSPPAAPGGTTTHTGLKEGNGFDFLPLFTHQMGEGKKTATAPYKQTGGAQHRANSRLFICAPDTIKRVCCGTGEFISPPCHRRSTSVLTL